MKCLAALCLATALPAADPLLFAEVASGPTLAGPWSGIGQAFTESWSEGPSVVRVGRQYIVYYDHYRDPKRWRGPPTSRTGRRWRRKCIFRRAASTAAF